MNVLIIGRTLPDEQNETGQFEYNHFIQMREMVENHRFLYGFIDTRGVTTLRKVGQQMGPYISGYYLPIGGRYDWIKFRFFKQLLTTFESEYGPIDLIHFHFPLMTMTIPIIDYLKKRKISIVVTEHGYQQQSILSKGERRLQAYFNDHADKVIAVSHNVSASNQKYTNPNQREILILPQIIDDVFSYRSKNQAIEYTFISTSRFSLENNHPKILQAFQAFSQRIPDSRLILVGDGPEKERIIELTEQLGLRKRVSFIGKVNSEIVLQQLAKSDVFLNTNEQGTFGLSIVEALISGTPVIIPEDHPLAIYVTNTNGLVFSKNDSASLLDKMFQAYQQTYDYPAISKESQLIFSNRGVINKLMRIYQEVLAN